MRIFTAISLLCLALGGLLSCNQLTSICRSYPQAESFPDQNIILFNTLDSGGHSIPMPVAMQRILLDSANQVLNQAEKKPLKIKQWCPCDSALVLLEGKDLDQLQINGKEVASSTGGKAGVGGQPPYGIKFNPTDGSLDWPQLIGAGSPNYVLSLPFAPAFERKNNSPTLFPLPPTNPALTPFIIAVMDTGLDLNVYEPIKSVLWVNTQEATGADHDGNGLVNDVSGWNFVQNINLPFDSNGHGSLVTSLIHEQLLAVRRAALPVRFMVLKTFSANGKGTLFDNLCALSYARQMKAKLINASWGFYSPTKSRLLDYFIRQLNEEGVTLVAAAGNKDEHLEKYPCGWVDESVYRNLDSNPFWPAAFSTLYPNVITVTTLDSIKKEFKMFGPANGPFTVCSAQNYSSRAVNVGVFNNTKGSVPHCGVLDITTLRDQTDVKYGSSFAAPVITGKLAGQLGPNWPGNDRDVLFHKLASTAPTILKTHSSLKDKIRHQYYVNRH